MTKNALRVIAVYRKAITAPQYEEQTYTAKKFNLSEVEFPEEFKYLMPETT